MPRKFLGTWRKHPQSRYPRNWAAIAGRAKTRAGWRCVRCGHPQKPDGTQLPCDAHCTHDPVPPGTPVNAIHRVLTVHHMDGNRANNTWWNLAVLCQRCHLTIQSTLDLDQAVLIPDLHGDWLTPYLQGYLRNKIRNGEQPPIGRPLAMEDYIRDHA